MSSEDEFKKFKWPFPKFPLHPNDSWHTYTLLVSSTVSTFSKIWMQKLNTVRVVNIETLHDLVEKRDPETPLITVSNHHSCIDDPFMWSILKWKTLFNPIYHRWTLAAHNICFTNKLHSTIFALGKNVPVVRGAGVYQRGMDFMLDRLNSGDWVHTFPEGRVNLEKKWIRFKWGVGRLVAESKKVPIVLPIYHFGMDSVLPNKRPYIPQIFQQVTVVVGEPICFKSQLEEWKKKGYTSEELRKAVTDKIQDEMDKLQAKGIKIHEKNLKMSQ